MTSDAKLAFRVEYDYVIMIDSKAIMSIIYLYI